MAIDSDCHSIAQKALELDALAPLVEHDPAECETCADYQAEFLAFARESMPKLAQGYLELARSATEAFENEKLRGRFLADLQEDNARLQKELTAREQELEEIQAAAAAPARKGRMSR
jgi:hypothetical protein